MFKLYFKMFTFEGKGKPKTIVLDWFLHWIILCFFYCLLTK